MSSDEEEVIKLVNISVLDKDIKEASNWAECESDPITNALKRITGKVYGIDRVMKEAFPVDKNGYKFAFNDDVVEYLSDWDNDSTAVISKIFAFIVLWSQPESQNKRGKN